VEWLTAALAAFIVIVPVELPDKTFIATLVLATRYSPWPVWLGVVSAFGIQCVVAVIAGRLLTLLPQLPVRLAAAGLFAVGAAILFVGARKGDPPDGAERFEQRVQDSRTGWRAFGASFLVLFSAEWGDRSQLLTASLVAAGRPPVPVFVGSWVALATVAAAGVVLGRVLMKRIRLSVVRLVGAAVCAILAVVTVVTTFA
jgi:putative Ca2+/H+ antiporter (TMEM165/GDT1 family)